MNNINQENEHDTLDTLSNDGQQKLESYDVEQSRVGSFYYYWRKFVVFLLGREKPSLFVQIIFYLTLFEVFIFELWNTISYLILQNPQYLKKHKHVDVHAIVELRGRDLYGGSAENFLTTLQQFHLLAILSWAIALVGAFLLWRGKKIANYLILAGILIYILGMFFLLGLKYFKEDVTLFDKIFLLTLFLLVAIHYFVVKYKKNEEELNYFEEKTDGIAQKD